MGKKKPDNNSITINNFKIINPISVGYRVRSLRGSQFRQWATKRLNEYIRKGFTKELKQIENKTKEINERGYD